MQLNSVLIHKRFFVVQAELTPTATEMSVRSDIIVWLIVATIIFNLVVFVHISLSFRLFSFDLKRGAAVPGTG